MLNLFAAAGHMDYARCGRLYLQLMTDFPHCHWLLLEFQKLLTGAYWALFYSFVHDSHASSELLKEMCTLFDFCMLKCNVQNLQRFDS